MVLFPWFPGTSDFFDEECSHFTKCTDVSRTCQWEKGTKNSLTPELDLSSILSAVKKKVKGLFHYWSELQPPYWFLREGEKEGKRDGERDDFQSIKQQFKYICSGCQEDEVNHISHRFITVSRRTEMLTF